MDGGLALALVTILAFGAFIAWAKTAGGQTTLRATWGDSGSIRREKGAGRKRSSARKKTPARRAATKRPTSR